MKEDLNFQILFFFSRPLVDKCFHELLGAAINTPKIEFYFNLPVKINSMRKIYFLRCTLRCTAVLAMLAAFLNSSEAQQVYWREGFESGQGFPSAVPYYPTHVLSSASGVWYLFLANRTNGSGGACAVNGGSLDHGRFYDYNGYVSKNPALTAADSGYMVTPVVDFGIGELHFKRGRVNRRLTVYKTADTSAAAATWTLVAQSTTVVAATCTDTTWTINDPMARRLKIVARSGTDTDIDSVWMTSTSPIVPVKFTGIHAASVNGFTKVTWNIATEINTRSYIVERSTDGMSFSKAAEVAATNAGNYSWIDNNATAGVAFYRVKAMDKDGRLSYSGVVKVAADLLKVEFLITPNMISGRTMNLQLNNLGKGTFGLRVINSGGQVVYTTSLLGETGSLSKAIQLPSSLPAGAYKVQLVSGTAILTKTAILQ